VPRETFLPGVLSVADTEFVFEMSSVADGSMRSSERENVARYLEEKNIDYRDLAVMIPKHSSDAFIVERIENGPIFLEGDALVTRGDGTVLSFSPADCLPIYGYTNGAGENGEDKVIVLAHAGWRGLDNGIISKSFEKATDYFKVDPQGFKVFIGPHICQNCYEVGDEVSDLFLPHKGAISHPNGKAHLDLAIVAQRQLKNIGIQDENIQISPICTFEDESLFSYRRGNYQERNIHLFGIKNGK